MSKKPTLAIVGRPNVGKSALFNRLAKKRIAIVDEEEGVTRDRLVTDVERDEFKFRLVDTGGIDLNSHDRFKNEIIAQAHLAIQESDTIVMVVDGRVGVTHQDEEVAKILLRSQKPLTLAVSKIDNSDLSSLTHAFQKLGIKNIVAISSTHNLGIDILLETAFHGFTFPEETTTRTGTKIAIVGKPNVGKSTLINSLLEEKRVVVSPLPGTTRDTIDLPLTYEGKEYLLMDTAGVRKKRAEKSTVEKFAYVRTLDAIERADVTLLVLDAEAGISEMEKKLLQTIEEAGKGCIILFNKWDLVKGYRMEHCLTALKETSPFLKMVPIIFISAKTGRNLDKIFPEIEKVKEARAHRLTTGELNKFLERAMQLNHPPSIGGKRLRIYYITQIATNPPRFILFVNSPKLLAETYRKYLINQFREHFAFAGVPLVFYLRGKKQREERKKALQPTPTKREEWDEEELDESYFV